jgi:hypothetical protein
VNGPAAGIASSVVNTRISQTYNFSFPRKTGESRNPYSHSPYF